MTQLGLEIFPKKVWIQNVLGFFAQKIHYGLSFSKDFVVGGDPAVPSLGWEWEGGEEPSWMVGQHMKVEREEPLGRV